MYYHLRKSTFTSKFEGKAQTLTPLNGLRSQSNFRKKPLRKKLRPRIATFALQKALKIS
jgi:hypothetical protein